MPFPVFTISSRSYPCAAAAPVPPQTPFPVRRHYGIAVFLPAGLRSLSRSGSVSARQCTEPAQRQKAETYPQNMIFRNRCGIVRPDSQKNPLHRENFCVIIRNVSTVCRAFLPAFFTLWSVFLWITLWITSDPIGRHLRSVPERHPSDCGSRR